jgi:threonine aldolase
MFFAEQTAESIMGAILRFEAEQASFAPAAIRQHAQQFSTDRFVAQMTAFLTQLAPEVRGIIPRRAARAVAELLQEEAA